MTPTDPEDPDAIRTERNIAALADRIAADRQQLREIIRAGINLGLVSEASAARAARMDRMTVRRIMGKHK